MFGISFTELLLIATVALMVVGPAKLPQMLGTLGKWTGKLRRITTDMRQQTGIDDLLRQEGLKGGLSELRGIVRGDLSSIGKAASVASTMGAAARARAQSMPPSAEANAPEPTSTSVEPSPDPYEGMESDFSREYPIEGCDGKDSLPDDLWTDGENAEPATDSGQAETDSDEAPAVQSAAATEASEKTPAAAPENADKSNDQATSKEPSQA